MSVWVFTDPPFYVLLLRRPEARAPGWQPVTGRVEDDDASLQAACIREIREESALGPPLELIDLGVESTFVGYDGATYHQRSFAARYRDPATATVSEEHEEARWVSVDEARALLRWEADRETLRSLVAALHKMT